MQITHTRNITNGKNTETPRTCTVDVPIPDDIQAFIDVFGIDAVIAVLRDSAIAAATKELGRVMQGGIHGCRRLSDEQIIAHMANWRLGIDYERRESDLINIDKITNPAIRSAALAAINAFESDLETVRIVRPPALAPAPVDGEPAIAPEGGKKRRK